MKEAEAYCPKDQKDWRKWLEKHHDKKQSVWLIFHKKTSPQYNLSWSDAVDEALCFGWIDSTARPIDDERYKQYFTVRKAISNWSKINKDKVEVLLKEGKMAQAGLQSIETAKANGSWHFLDDVEALIVPDDLSEALHKKPEDLAYYNGLSKSSKKGVLYWVISAKREATRSKRIEEVVASACEQRLPKAVG